MERVDVRGVVGWKIAVGLDVSGPLEWVELPFCFGGG